MYSQKTEEHSILNYFQEQNISTGTLLDIGSADGKVMSNSYQLLLNGWKGVMVEPSAHLIPALIKNMEGLNTEIVNAVVGITAGWQTFYESNGDFLSTTNTDHVAKWSHVPFKPTQVYGIHFAALKEKYGDIFDFINIDTEATSAELLLKMFREFQNCKLWCIEHDGRKEEILNLAAGYKEILFNDENLLIGKCS